MGCTCIYSAFPLDKLAVLTLQTKAEAEHKRFKACSMEYGLNIITRINCLQNRFSIKAVEPIVVPTLIQGLLEDGGNSGNNNNNKNNNNNNNGDGDAGDSGEGNDWNVHHGGFPWSYYMGALFSFHSQGDHVPMIQRLLENRKFLFCMLSMFSFLSFSQLGSAIALGRTSEEKEVEYKEVVWEIRGSDCRQLIRDSSKDEFVVVGSSSSSMGSSSSLSKNSIQIGDMKSSLGIQGLWFRCKELFMRLMLPDGFPHSVTSDYLEYSLWRGVQGVASQISGVLATQSLLYAVGLGKGAIPTAAAINWVLKDGIGYVSKIMLSKYGRHFDVNPKGWRLFADLLENTAYGLEMLTPAFPHLFVFIGATAGAARSAAALIQAATRSCFYAGFAAKRNFAEVIAKGEAQGMVSKSIGIMLGIALANRIGSSTPLALVAFGVVTWIHMFCNLKSYQSIQLRTLNPYRASLVFSEYLLSGQVPSVRDINNEEPFFPAVPILDASLARKSDSPNLSPEAKSAASEIQRRLHLGSKLSDVIYRREDAVALFDLYRNENYMLTEHDSNFCVILKRSASPVDLLRSLYHVTYLYWLERNAGIKSTTVANDCRPGGKLQISLDYVQREFNHLRDDCDSVGWVTDALISRPSPNRISLDVASSTET